LLATFGARPCAAARDRNLARGEMGNNSVVQQNEREATA